MGRVEAREGLLFVLQSLEPDPELAELILSVVKSYLQLAQSVFLANL
jgi:hypothetical protein